MPERIEILGLPLGELEESLAGMGQARYRSRQIFGWIYRKGVLSFDDMTNLSQGLRDELSDRFILNGISEESFIQGHDGTRKYIFRLSDGLIIESVLMMDVGKKGWTACVSTQVGCPVGCKFCLTGQVGFFRNLSASEIVGQVLPMIRSLPSGGRISNIVLMGMGEPLLNYKNVVRAIRIMMSEGGLQISPRRITLSTVGIPHMMLRLGNDLGVNLAVSLTAPTDELRSYLIPINKRYPLSSIIKTCRKYPLKKMMTIEYVLLDGVNDSIQDARSLISLIKGLWCKVNLIPYNPNPGIGFKAPSEGKIRKFQKMLLDAHITTIVRKSKGGEVQGACGQLGALLLGRK